MIAYGTTWKATEIKGKVIAHPTKRQLRVQWTIGEKPYVSEHGMAFLHNRHHLSVPASYVQDRAEQIIRPTHSEVEEGRGFWHRKRCKMRSRKTRMLMKYPPPPPPPPVREQVGTQSTSVDDILEPHGQKWEVLDSRISIFQRGITLRLHLVSMNLI